MNKIISISGEPASGKSTTIKEIKRELITTKMKPNFIRSAGDGILQLLDFIKN